jgi:Ca2+-binding EF-hand superfamily protein
MLEIEVENQALTDNGLVKLGRMIKPELKARYRRDEKKSQSDEEILIEMKRILDLDKDGVVKYDELVLTSWSD